MDEIENISEDILEVIEEELDGEFSALSDEEVLAICKEDLKIAEKAKEDINEKIAKWRDLYEGKPLGNETKGRSRYVSKEAQKAVNWWIPNAMKPFMASNDIVGFTPRTFDDVEKSKSQDVLLNYQFNEGFDKYTFLHRSLQLFSSEGTVVARTGWIHEDEEEVVPFEGASPEEVMELEAQGAEIEIEEAVQVEVPDINMGTRVDTITKGTATFRKTTTSQPTAEVIKIEDFFIIGESIEKSDACIQRIDTNRSELRKQDKAYNPNGIYENVDDIVVKSKEQLDSTLGQQRQTDLETYGSPDENDTNDRAREEVTIYEYYGKIDVDGDGIAEPIVCVWASDGTILRISDNPFPDKLPPFIGTAFMPIPFSFYGNGLPYFLEDVTQVKTAITRTAIDLMATATNGLKHVQKTSIDAFNIRKLKQAKIGDVIEWNDLNGYKPEIRAEIPSTLMPLMEHFTAEGENESGITRYNQGLDAKSLNKTATGITAIMSQAQMRTWETTSRYAEQFIKPLFRKWVAYNQAFLDMDVAIRVAGDKYTSVSPDDIGGEFDLSINVAIAGSEETKSQKVIGMLQMITPLVQGGILPANHITKLIAELEELSGFKELANELQEIAEAKEQAKNQAVEMFLGMPEEAQMQIMQMVQAQQQQSQTGGQPQ